MADGIVREGSRSGSKDRCKLRDEARRLGRQDLIEGGRCRGA